MSSFNWTPVNEQLPEEEDRYLITRSSKFAGDLHRIVEFAYFCFCVTSYDDASYGDLPCYGGDEGGRDDDICLKCSKGRPGFARWSDYSDTYVVIDDVTAWAPVPEPYDE